MGIQDIFVSLLVIEHYISSKQNLYTRGGGKGDFLAVIELLGESFPAPFPFL